MSQGDPVMCLKTYRTGSELMVAVCDSDLLGRSFQEGPLQIEVYPEFYGRERASHDEVERALVRATIANLVGENSVGCAIRMQCVAEENVLFIGGVPCAQMIRM
ncbi:MAG: DUF424 family protein [Methanotrichaceae archaeon]|nr:DUF424 family protein [Methanotrichaceae archaeon]